MAKEKLFYIGIKGLIENKAGLVLLLKADVTNHRAPTVAYWDLPGGRIQVGQDALIALKREIKEETGISEIIKPKFFSAVISNHIIPLEDGTKVGLALMIYQVQVAEKSRITLSEEHIGIEWVDKKEAAKRLANKYPPEFTEKLL